MVATTNMGTATLTVWAGNQQTTDQEDKKIRKIYSPIVELHLKNYILF